MSGYVVDPENEDRAILSDGRLAGSIRVAPVGSELTPQEWKQQPIIGYAAGVLDQGGDDQ